jgi:hypothetical protein
MQLIVGRNCTLQVSQTNDTITVSECDGNGNIINKVKAYRSLSRIQQNEHCNQLLQDVRFAEPMDLKNHPVIKHF